MENTSVVATATENAIDLSTIKLGIEYPELLQGNSSATHAAVNIRRALKLAFPSIKFSVKTRYASYMSAVDIRWTDGPTVAEVETITDRHQYEDFDGMTDCGVSRKDGKAFREVFGSARFITARREWSDAAIQFALDFVSNRFGIPTPTVSDFQQGRLNSTTSINWWYEMGRVLENRGQSLL